MIVVEVTVELMRSYEKNECRSHNNSICNKSPHDQSTWTDVGADVQQNSIQRHLDAATLQRCNTAML